MSTGPASAAYLATHGQARTEQIAKLYADMTAEGLSYLDKIEELCEQIGVTRRTVERHLSRARDQGLLPHTARTRPEWRPRT